MAVHKGIRSKSSPQPQPQHAKGARVGGPAKRTNPTTQPQPANGNRPRDHQKKAELFKTFERLNHGYGTALAALDRLRAKDRLPGKRVFPIECLNDFRNRTEMLRALANRDLLRLLAGHEEWEVERYSSP
ncbi:MAG TPA: hypothetical protein VIB39_19980 [Candidatus Angelobacter sp.]|jgi:hypothetical protein